MWFMSISILLLSWDSFGNVSINCFYCCWSLLVESFSNCINVFSLLRWCLLTYSCFSMSITLSTLCEFMCCNFSIFLFSFCRSFNFCSSSVVILYFIYGCFIDYFYCYVFKLNIIVHFKAISVSIAIFYSIVCMLLSG